MTKDHQKSDLKELLYLEKYSWMVDHHPTSLIHRMIFPHQHEKFEQPNIEYEKLSERQKRIRVLLALEKVAHHNPENFTENELNLLVSSRHGILYRQFVLLKYLGLTAWAGWTLTSRTFTKSNLCLLGGAVVLNKVIDQVPYLFKEQIRFNRGLRLADSYLKKHNNDISIFARLLNPLATHHEIEHFNID